VHVSVIGMNPEPAAAVRAAAAAGEAARRNMHESRCAFRQAQVDLAEEVALRAAALRSLARSPFIAVRSIRCEVCGGMLTLRGRVSSFYLKQIALAAVRHLEQVREVRNEVEVGYGARRAFLSIDAASPRLPR
jgi:osmotically-inducible protein OsmY